MLGFQACINAYLGRKGDPDDPNSFDFLYSPWFIPLYIIDIPFSLVTDTVTVPYDLYHLNDIDGSEGVDNETHANKMLEYCDNVRSGKTPPAFYSSEELQLRRRGGIFHHGLRP
jgi:hypothetical protein